MKKLKTASFLKQKMELQRMRQGLAREFLEKKNLVLQKLQELKRSGKGIEEIYKYTNEIIFEEEDEEEEGITSSQMGDDSGGSHHHPYEYSQRSKSVNDAYQKLGAHDESR